MAWIAFDDQTQSVLSELSGAPVTLAKSSTDPLDYALASKRNSVVLVPIGTTGEVVLLTVRKNLRREPAPPPAPPSAPPAKPETVPAKQETTQSMHYVSSGFLGLGDEVELDQEPQPRKSWWKRLFD
jgi:hypothetical protein